MERPNIKDYQDGKGEVMLGLFNHFIQLQENYINHLETKVKNLSSNNCVSGSNAANKCEECSKELESGTVFCSADCRQHYCH